jgi:hypothetical protein
MKKLLPLAMLALLAGATGELLGAPIRTYSDSSKVNLIRKIDLDTFTLTTSVAWTDRVNVSGSPSPTLAVDGGHNVSQVNFNAASMTDNKVSFQVQFDSAVTIDQLRQIFYGANETPVQYRIRGSNSSFADADLQTLIDWTDPGTGSRIIDSNLNLTSLGGTIQYLKIDYVGTRGTSAAYRLIEIQAFAPAGQTISTTSGYNLFYDQATKVTSFGSTTRSPLPEFQGSDNPNSLTDLDLTSQLRPLGGAGGDWSRYVVIGLSDSYKLAGASVSPTFTQTWQGIRIEVSNALAVDENTVWTTVYQTSTPTTSVGSLLMKFTSQEWARWVRISTTPLTVEATIGGSMSEFELFAVAVPEPMSAGAMGLMAAGLMLRRRR